MGGEVVTFLIGLLVGLLISHISERIGVAHGRIQVVRFILLRVDEIIGTKEAGVVLDWMDELENNGAHRALGGFVKELPNSDNKEWAVKS
jgi:hypothetical protein